LASADHRDRLMTLDTQFGSLSRCGDLEVARSELDAAIKEFPSEPGLYQLLGIVDAQQGNRAAAKSDSFRSCRKERKHWQCAVPIKPD